MTEKPPKFSTVVFFLALLVVIPTATWVGMLVPQLVVDAAGGIQSYLAEMGIFDQKNSSLIASPTGLRMSSEIPRFESPWENSAPRFPTAHPPQALSSTPPAQTRDLIATNLPPNGADGNPPLQWAEKLIQNAAATVMADPATDAQGVIRASHEMSENAIDPSPVHPASFAVGTLGTTSSRGINHPSGKERLHPQPDSISLIGWSVQQRDGAEPQSSDSAKIEAHSTPPQGVIRGGPQQQQYSPSIPANRPSANLNDTRPSRSYPRSPGGGSMGHEQTPRMFSPDDSKVRELELTLRRLGAVKYVLEEESASGRFYFVAEVPQPGEETRRQVFQAVDSDPYRAMEHVVQQIEASRR